MNFRELDEAFKGLDRSFKHVNTDMNKVFTDMNKIFDRMTKSMNQASPPEQHPWEKWFAWHPVKIKGKTQWMKTVYRRTKMKYGDPRMQHEWEYGDMFDVLKEAGE